MTTPIHTSRIFVAPLVRRQSLPLQLSLNSQLQKVEERALAKVTETQLVKIKELVEKAKQHFDVREFIESTLHDLKNRLKNLNKEKFCTLRLAIFELSSLSTSSIPDLLKTQTQILDLLINCFQMDPISQETLVGLLDIIKQLSKILTTDIFENYTPSIKTRITLVFSEAIFSYVRHEGPVTKETKLALQTTIDSLEQFKNSKNPDIHLRFSLGLCIEACKRLKSTQSFSAKLMGAPRKVLMSLQDLYKNKDLVKFLSDFLEACKDLDAQIEREWFDNLCSLNNLVAISGPDAVYKLISVQKVLKISFTNCNWKFLYGCLEIIQEILVGQRGDSWFDEYQKLITGTDEKGFVSKQYYLPRNVIEGALFGVSGLLKNDPSLNKSKNKLKLEGIIHLIGLKRSNLFSRATEKVIADKIINLGIFLTHQLLKKTHTGIEKTLFEPLQADDEYGAKGVVELYHTYNYTGAGNKKDNFQFVSLANKLGFLSKPPQELVKANKDPLENYYSAITFLNHSSSEDDFSWFDKLEAIQIVLTRFGKTCDSNYLYQCLDLLQEISGLPKGDNSIACIEESDSKTLTSKVNFNRIEGSTIKMILAGIPKGYQNKVDPKTPLKGLIHLIGTERPFLSRLRDSAKEQLINKKALDLGIFLINNLIKQFGYFLEECLFELIHPDDSCGVDGLFTLYNAYPGNSRTKNMDRAIELAKELKHNYLLKLLLKEPHKNKTLTLNDNSKLDPIKMTLFRIILPQTPQQLQDLDPASKHIPNARTTQLLAQLTKKTSSIDITLFNDDYDDLKSAIAKGNDAIVQSLIDKHPDLVNIRDKHDNTCLMFACRTGRINIVKILLEAGSNMNASNCIGYNALHLAVLSGNIELVKHLLQIAQFLIESKQKDGYTPVILAYHYFEKKEIYELLIKAGALNKVELN